MQSTSAIALVSLVVAVQRMPAQMERLGTVHFQTSCSPTVASRFDRAVALLHSFEFGSSIRAFNEVLAVDSTCAMAYWGIALSRWSNPMAARVRTPEQLAPGRKAAESALRVGANATARERSYISAVAELYKDYEHVNQGARVASYEAREFKTPCVNRKGRKMSATGMPSPGSGNPKLGGMMPMTSAVRPVEKVICLPTIARSAPN